MAYVCSVFVLQTLIFVSASIFAQSAFVDHREYSGGPGVYGLDMWFGRHNILNHFSFVAAKWLSDAFIIWRCYTLFQSVANTWLVLLAPCCLYIASSVLSIMFLIQIFGNAHAPGTDTGWTAPFLAATPGLNIAISIVIIARLVLQNHQMKVPSAIEAPPVSRISLLTILVESGFAHAVHSIFFLLLFVARSPVSEVFLQSFSQVQTTTMFLIILKGKDWTTSRNSINIFIVRTPNKAFKLPTLLRDNTPKSFDLSDTWKRSGLTAQVAVTRHVEVRSSLRLEPLRASYLNSKRGTVVVANDSI
ncbi:hypothetical protein PQX77_012110 [Marasmius sp. AFHP31]|nr:hypothetical protein PQX77_012110 [Marasmius sp. AFHP31]